MLDLNWECIDYEKKQGIMQTFMLAHLFFTKSFGRFGKK